MSARTGVGCCDRQLAVAIRSLRRTGKSAGPFGSVAYLARTAAYRWPRYVFLEPHTIAHEADLANEDHVVQNAALEIADRLGIGIATLDTGLWVLGARFARSRLKLKQLLTDPSAFEAFIRDQRIQTEAAAFALKSVAQAMADRRGR